MAAATIDLGLRERKKLAMRASLSAIALRLAMERGVDQVRIDDIVAEAGVSPRTFSNYFSSKEAAIVGTAISRAELVRAKLRERPAEEPIRDALSHAVSVLFPHEPDRNWMARSQLVRSDPALQAEEHRSDREVERVLAEEVASRTGTDSDNDLFPRLVAATFVATLQTAVLFWLDRPSGMTLAETVATALNQLSIVQPEPVSKPGI